MELQLEVQDFQITEGQFEEIFNCILKKNLLSTLAECHLGCQVHQK